MRGALLGDELYLPNFSPTWVPASTPNHKTYLCARKVAAWLRENLIRLVAEGAGLFRARRGREAGWDSKHLLQIIQQKFCHGCMVAASTMRVMSCLLASRAPPSQVADGPLRAIPASPADPPVHGPEAAAAVPAACRYRCCRPGAGNRHRLGPELAALRRRCRGSHR